MKPQSSITSYSRKTLEKYIVDNGFETFRAAQILHWVFQRRVSSWSECNNLPKELRSVLARDILLSSLQCVEEFPSTRSDSVKYLFKTHDCALLETVLIYGSDRVTICLSTQIGCRYACSFCASGKDGFVRDLSPSEIIDQVRVVTCRLGRAVDNIVFMGMGEPFDNYDATLSAIRVIISPDGFGMSPRRITVSTVGLLPAIRSFAQEDLSQVKLSISLHAATDETRSRLMPIAQHYTIDDLVQTVCSVRDSFKRTVTVEYLLIKDVNDSKRDSDALAVIARTLKAKVNLIGYNPIEGSAYASATMEEVDIFKVRLEKARVPVTVRYSAGADISAACGQLRLKKNAAG